jgi:hypothetical protein
MTPLLLAFGRNLKLAYLTPDLLPLAPLWFIINYLALYKCSKNNNNLANPCHLPTNCDASFVLNYWQDWRMLFEFVFCFRC